METIKRAIIVAAGEGTRLRPVTLTTPKPLVKVNGTRLIDTIIQALKQNGIHEIYIVTGYKKEQFHEVYKDDPDITVLENVRYHDSNNVTSLYTAMAYIPGSFILEGDLRIMNPKILDPVISRSGYLATYMADTPEWTLKVKDGLIDEYCTKGGKNCHRLWGISMWNTDDGQKLAELVRHQVEDVKELNIFWDELALSHVKDTFHLGIREISLSDVVEIDTFEELVSLDPSYINFCQAK